MMGIDLKFLAPLAERIAVALERMAGAPEVIAETSRLQAAVLAGHAPEVVAAMPQPPLHLVGGKAKSNGKHR